MPRQITITVTNSLQGDTNPALVSFVDGYPAATDPGNDAVFLAHCLAYMDAALRTVGASGLKITGAKVAPVEAGVVGASTSLPFPASEYGALYGSVPGATLHTVFPMSTGAGGTGWAPRGSSCLVTEYTSSGGRHNGRHYLPFVCRESVDPGNGLFYDSALASVKAAWDAAFFDVIPQVVTKATGAAHSILGVRVSSNVARLRSRMK